MDSFTQIVLGIATAEVVAGKILQNKTFVYGAILGTLPDLDVLIGKLLSDVDGVAIHRGLSHSLLFFIFLAPLLGFIISKIERKSINFKKASFLAFYCLLTHVLLDMFTSWGTQIFWPFANRIAFKTIFVIDPLYTIPLLISLIYVFKNQEFLMRQKYVFRGIAISSLYLMLSCILKITALSQFEKALADKNINYTDLIVKPTAFNTILWNANVATTSGYYIADYSFFDTKAINFQYFPKDKVLEKKLESSEDFHKLKEISEGWYTVSQQNKTLYFNDLRFGLLNTNPENLQFAFRYEFYVNEKGDLMAKEAPKNPRDGKALLQKIFKRVQGN